MKYDLTKLEEKFWQFIKADVLNIMDINQFDFYERFH